MKQICLWFLILCLLAHGAPVASDTLTDTGTTTVVVIPVSGDVEPGMAAFIARATREAALHRKPLIIIEMDTFGGRVDAAFQIVDTILAVPDSIKTIAFVRTKAISAGALIALACNQLAMRPNTTIGDCAPIALSNDGPQMLGEKFQSPLRAKFRALAKRNGYPVHLAEAMATASGSITKVVLPDTILYLDSIALAELPARTKALIREKSTIVTPGELLTMNDTEAHALGFSLGSSATLEEFLQSRNIGPYSILRIQESWSESMVRLLTKIAPILLMIGLAALYAEFKSPGFGVMGIIGICALGLVFAGQYLVGLANYTELLIIAIGMVLLAIEVFVLPGFGIAGFSGIALILVGTVLSFQDFVLPAPEMPWQMELLKTNILTVLGSVCGSLILLLLFLRFVTPRMTRIIPGPYLAADLSDAHAPAGNAEKIFVGARGIVTKPLRPAGTMVIDGQTFDVVADGEFIDKDSPVQVSQINGARIVVIRDGSHG